MGNDKFISVNASWPLIEGLDLISQSFFALTNLAENEEEEYQALRILNGIPEMGKEISDENRLKYAPKQFYIKTEDEMYKLFKQRICQAKQ